MSLTIGELSGFLTLDDKDFNRGVDQAGGKFSGLMAGLGKAAVAGAAVVAGAMAATAVAGVKEFATFEKGMNEAFTLLPGISQDAMDAMSRDVRDFSMEMGTATDEVVPALYSALSAGVPKGNVFEFLEVANQAAIGGVTDLETAVDGITSVVNAYGDDVISAGEASDAMFTAVRLGKTTFGELSSSLSNVIPIAAANGVAFDDVAAALATMTAQGIPTAQATTQIRGALVELSDSGTDVGKAFEKVAGESFREFIASGGDMAGVMEILEQAAEADGVSIDQLFGSVEAGGAALALSGANLESYQAGLDEMANKAGASEAAHAQMDQGVSRAFERIGVAWDEMKKTIGDALAPAVTAAAESVMGALGSFITGFQQAETEAGRSVNEIIGGAQGMGSRVREAFSTIATFITETVVPAFQRLLAWWEVNGPTIIATATEIGDAIREGIGAIIERVRELWDDHGPAIIATVASIAAAITTAAESLATAAQWVVENWNVIGPIVAAVAGVIATLLIPHYIALGVQATISAAKNVAAWVVKSTAAIRHGARIIATMVKVMAQGAVWIATHVAQAAVFVARWVVMGAKATLHAAKVVAGWVMTGAAAVAQAAVHVAQVGVMVAKWVFLGAQSLLHAAKVAAAWLIAMGPIALVVAAVVGLVALIVANWDTIKAKTAELWERVKKFTSAAWEALKTAVSTGIENVLTFFRELPGKILSAIGNLGTLLFDAGKNVVQGLIDGVKSMVGAVGDAISGVAEKVTRFLPWSPAKEGPLRSNPPEVGGRNIVRMLAKGMHGSLGDVVREAEAIAKAAAVDIGPAAFGGVSLGSAAMAGAGAGVGGPTYQLNVDNHATRSMDERALAQQLNELSLLHGGRR